MKFLFTLTILMFSLIAHSSVLESARRSFSAGEHKHAEKLLFQISKADEDFPEASELLIQNYFKNKNYSKLLSSAIFYRRWFEQNSSLLTYRPKIFALEALSLAMNCHFKSAEAVLEISEQYAQQFKVSNNFIAQTKQQIKMTKSFPEFLAKTNQTQASKELSDKKDLRNLWKVEFEQLDQLPNAKNLQLKLEDLCKK